MLHHDEQVWHRALRVNFEFRRDKIIYKCRELILWVTGEFSKQLDLADQLLGSVVIIEQILHHLNSDYCIGSNVLGFHDLAETACSKWL